jgi:hypothetical protein
MASCLSTLPSPSSLKPGEKVGGVVTGIVGIYDIVACSDKKLAVADNNSMVKFFNKGKLVKTLEDRCQFLSKLDFDQPTATRSAKSSWLKSSTSTS